jgi:signal transduction histidine kinase
MARFKERFYVALPVHWFRDAVLKLPLLWRDLLRLLFPGTIAIALIISLLYQQLWHLSFEPYKHQSQSLISEAGRSVFRNIGALRRDILFLADELNHQEFSGANEALALSSIEMFFQRFSAASQLYDQIRWIDKNGQELVRVDKTLSGVKILEHSALQNKSERYYVQEGWKLAPGEVYFSPLDLNMEYGQIVSPLKPMIRVVSPVFSDDGETYKGLVVINFLAGPLLDELRNLSQHSEIELSLFNSEGYWLMDAQSRNEWGFMYQQPSWKLDKKEPRLWGMMQSHKDGDLLSKDGFWSFQTFRLGSVEALGPEWKLAVHISGHTLTMLRQNILLWSVLAGLILFSLALWVCWRLAISIYDRDMANQALHHKQVALKQSNHSLQDSLQKLKVAQQGLFQAEKLSSLGLMVAGVAHELNTPLGAALLTTSGLQDRRKTFGLAIEDGLRASDLQSYLDNFDEGIVIVEKNLLRGAELVNTFKRLAVDRAQEEQRVFHLSELLKDLQHTSWVRFNKKNQTIATNIDKDIQFDSYPGALGRVFENLVNNAFMHGFSEDQGGEVHISVNSVSSSEVSIQISDNGRGIDSDILSKIFDPFFTTGRIRGGMGLGLHLVHQLVTHLLEGTISIESKLGEGVQITLCLPLKVQGSHSSDANS